MTTPFNTLAAARAWYADWLTQDALPLWRNVGIDPRTGAFEEKLTVEGQPIAAPRRARVQARQVWSFASAASAGWGADYAAVARRGFEAYRTAYQRPDGLYAFSVDENGEIIDAQSWLYEQAFTLLAMAVLERLDGDLRDEAYALRGALQALRNPAGGWREEGEQPFQANAHMHLFEAALAWEAVGDASWSVVADEIADLALTRFIDPVTGVLREFFDADWAARADADGGLIEPGHQFEWAFLLDAWAQRRGQDNEAVVRRLYAHGLTGVDEARRVAVGGLWAGGAIRDPVARLWGQTEFLRAALKFGTEADALVAANGLYPFLQTPRRGVWRDKLEADGTFADEPAPATSLYHLVGGLMTLIA
ncbi:AGE family epimerase/isomerase [Phenylobacterium sp.]|uniref:AGE family epimerase/isomerase n=1 Tax=Phenylobacterium sp. TaxID=1871053 RepID=UPI00378348AB